MRNIVTIVIIVAAAGLFYVYIIPQYQNVQTLLADGRRYDDVLAKSVELRSLREQLKEKLENLSSTNLERLEKMLPEDMDAIHFILDLDNLARRQGIIIQDIQITEGEGSAPQNDEDSGQETSSGPYKISSINFAFTSSYSEMLLFMREIEDSLRIMDVTSISAKSSDEDPFLQDYDVTVQAYELN